MKVGNMKNRFAVKSGINALACATVVSLSACTSVRDATDWIPGVDSNEEIQAEKNQQAMEKQARERQLYEDKAAFAPTNLSASDADAKINVIIGKKYAADNEVKREDIGIEVNAGVVTLTGTVDSDAAAVRAISLAKSTTGVSRVISRLIVIQLRKNEE